jgi:phosphatidate phosphatase APP1
MEPIAAKKAQNFREYAALYPEFAFVFVGDNGAWVFPTRGTREPRKF